MTPAILVASQAVATWRGIETDQNNGESPSRHFFSLARDRRGALEKKRKEED